MNSLWNTNTELFKNRFPSLYEMLKTQLNNFNSPENLSISQAKNSFPTLLFKREDGSLVALHSKYDPEREAQQALNLFSAKEKDTEAALFLSPGLGYLPVAFAKKYPEIPIIIAESNPLWLFTAFSALDWTPLFTHKNLIILTDCNSQTVLSVLRHYQAEKIETFSSSGQKFHDQAFFEEIKEGLKQEEEKNKVNKNTLKKFSHLWLRNSCKNLHFLAEKDGIKNYTGILTKERIHLPFIILAAGPSLQKILPHLKELKERAVLVCVDTALKACLKAGVEPDFIILVDPQYYCVRHLDFLSSPSSVLILESAVWPSAFRFNCRKIIMCSSLFPIGQYFEKQLGSKGKLGAGGSVTTTAWDFARVCGASEIFLAGMDLGFPGKQTHIRGSQFEEAAHSNSSRTSPAETKGVSSLMGAAPSAAKDYLGQPILTDKRMSVFAWWFEHNCNIARADGQITYTLTKESLAIKGIECTEVQDFLLRPKMTEEKQIFFKLAESIQVKNEKSFSKVYDSFEKDLETLQSLAKRGLDLCRKTLEKPEKAKETFALLNSIDSQILTSSCKDAAALVFPTEDRLKSLFTPSGNKERDSLNYSSIIYTELIKAVKEYIKYL